jgi:hypothetical protein
MMTLAILKRCTQCSTALFFAFVVSSAVLITLPGFLFYYFWMEAGFGVSTLVGFLIGSFTISSLEVIGATIAAFGRVLRKPAKSKIQQPESKG